MLILVRHGRTKLNAAGLLQGRLDEPLDLVGLAQADALAVVLKGVDRVVSSPLLRALQTAERLGAPVEIDDRWIELDYGTYDGTPVGEIGAEVWARWREDDHHVPAGGEALADLATRVFPACEELARDAETADIVVVSHVSPIKAAVAWAVGAGVAISWRSHLDQASITRIGMNQWGPVLRTFNDTCHLAAVKPL